MTTPRLSNPNRIFAFVRLAVAGTCVLTAAALAFVATANSNNSSGPASKNQVLANNFAENSVSDESGPNPATAAQEEYSKRAYPADQIDLSLLINAQAGFANFKANATPPPAPTASPSSTPDITPTPSPSATATPRRRRGGRRRATSTPTPTPMTIINDRPSPP